jgi:diaminopimelate epimerase
MAGEFTYAVGTESGDSYAVFVDPEGIRTDSSADFADVARLVEVPIAGIVRLIPQTGSEAEWFMDVRNPDGSATTTSANGVRVASAFLISEKLVVVVVGSGERFTIDTRDGELDVQAGGNGLFRVDLGRWKFGERDSHKFEVQLGGSHMVTVLKSVADLDALELPDIATAEEELVFAAAEAALIDDGIGRFRFRVFRPGVDEVASSGTGAAAAALAMRHNTGAGKTHNWRAESRGGSIGIQMFPTEDGEHVSIHGQAELTATGTVKI